MKTADTRALLAQYVKQGSEPAFRELVACYVDLVYSTALRLVDGHVHLAEDVVQTVFIALAQKAATLASDPMLGGWLHRHTCYVASTTMRTERRRQNRERQAVEMSALQDHSQANLAQLAPVLDEAINKLGAADRAAILLRFFEERDFRSVGEVLGSNEDAARMRVNRAVEKLHVLLKNHGVTCSGAALGATLTTGLVTASPAGLAATIAGTALATATTGGGLALSLLKITAMTKMKLGVAAALVLAAAVTPLLTQHRSLL